MPDALAFVGKRRTPGSDGADRDYSGRYMCPTVSEDSVYMFLAAWKIANKYGASRGFRCASHRSRRCFVRKASFAKHSRCGVDNRPTGIRRDLRAENGLYTGEPRKRHNTFRGRAYSCRDGSATRPRLIAGRPPAAFVLGC